MKIRVRVEEENPKIECEKAHTIKPSKTKNGFQQ